MRQRASGRANTEAQLHAALYPQVVPQASNPNAFNISPYSPPHVKTFMAAVLASTQQPSLHASLPASSAAPVSAHRMPRPSAPIKQRTTYGTSFQAPTAADLRAARGPQASEAPPLGHSFSQDDLAAARASAVGQIHAAVQGSSARLRSSLGRVDGDQDGCVSYGQFLTSLRRLGVDLSTPELGSLLTTMDAEGKGVVSIDRVAAVVRDAQQVPARSNPPPPETQGGRTLYTSPPPATPEWQPVVAMRRATWRSGCDTANLRRLLREVSYLTGRSGVSAADLGAALRMGGVALPHETTDAVVRIASGGADGAHASPEALVALLEASDAHTVGNANSPAPTSGMHVKQPASMATAANGNASMVSRHQRRDNLQAQKMLKRASDAVQDVSKSAANDGNTRLPAHIRRLKQVFRAGKSLKGPATDDVPADQLSLTQLRYGLSKIGVQLSNSDFARFADHLGGAQHGTVSFEQIKGVLAGDAAKQPSMHMNAAPVVAEVFSAGAEHTAPSTRSEHRLRQRVGYKAPLHHPHRYFLEGALQTQPVGTPLDAAALEALKEGYTLPPDDAPDAPSPIRPTSTPEGAQAQRNKPTRGGRGGSWQAASTPDLITGHGEDSHLPSRRSRRQVPPAAAGSTARLSLLPGGRDPPPARSASAPRERSSRNTEHIMSPGQQEGDRGYGLRGYVTQGGELTADARAARRHMRHTGLGEQQPQAPPPPSPVRSMSHGRFRPRDSASSLAELAMGGRVEGPSRNSEPPPAARPQGGSPRSRVQQRSGSLQQGHLGRDLTPLPGCSDDGAPTPSSGAPPSTGISLDGYATSGRGSWRARSAAAQQEWATKQQYRASHWMGGVDLIGMEPCVKQWAHKQAPRARQTEGKRDAPAAQQQGVPAPSPVTSAAPDKQVGGKGEGDVGENTRVFRPAVRPPLPPAW